MRDQKFGTKVQDGNSSVLPQNLNDVGQARGQLLGFKLDKISDSVSGQTNVDKKGYMTALNSQPINSDVDIGDFKKARLLLKSVVTSEPKNANGWVAAARLEELDGKLQAARNILHQGLQYNENSEDLWLELARLEPQDKARAVLAKAVSSLPKSVKLWIAASDLENDKQVKSKVLRMALENLPNVLKLWKQLIELEEKSEAKQLLYKAVECIPNELELWMALAKLENYEQAKAVLNKARYQLPTEREPWLSAAKLEESQGNVGRIEGIIKKGSFLRDNFSAAGFGEK